MGIRPGLAGPELLDNDSFRKRIDGQESTKQTAEGVHNNNESK